jgi:DNA-binding CsgD family transcriptional regulator
MNIQWPLIGRSSELDLIRRRLDADPGAIVLAGPPGVGKTMLALEVLKEAVSRGYTVARVVGTKATAGLPFGAFASFLPELSPTLDRTEMLSRVAAAVSAAGANRRVALLVDDAHLLDDSSAAVAYQLAVSGVVFVVVTVRSGEPAPDPVLALWKDGVADRIDLQALPEAEVDQLLTIVLGAPLEHTTQHLIFERSAGNCLFIREWVLGSLEAGVLRNEGGLWRLKAPLHASARLVELVEARLSGVSADERTALECLALHEPLGLRYFERLGGDGIVALERRGLVLTERDGQRLEVRLSHPLYADVLRLQLSALRTRQLSRSLADSIGGFGGRRRDDLLRSAILRLEGDGGVDPSTMTAAAQRAWTLHDLNLAERLVRAGIEVEVTFDGRLLLAQVLSVTGRGEEAEGILSQLADDTNDDDRRGRLAIARMDNLCYSLGRLAEAIKAAESAEAIIRDRRWKDEITAYRATLLEVSGQGMAALAVVEPLLQRSDGQALAWASITASFVLAKSGQLAQAIELSERGLSAKATSGAGPMPWSRALLIGIRSLVHMFAGRLAEAETLASREFEKEVAMGVAEGAWVVGSALCPVFIAQGRVSTAVRWGREAVALARDHARLVILNSALCTLAEALALSGQPAEAAVAMQELEALPLPFVRIWASEAARARAWVSVAEGNLTKATAELSEAADMAREKGEWVWEAAALHDLARLGQARTVAPRLAELASMIEGRFAPARAAHAHGLAARDPESLASASRQFEELGALLLAAEAGIEATAAWRRAGDVRRAVAAERRAVELRALCEGAVTPTLANAISARTALSGRELEIARLAADHRSNKQIAHLLNLSVRTVENKLQAAYEKLGIHGREELADALQGH